MKATEIKLKEGERIDEVNEKISLISRRDGLTFGTDAFLLASFIRPASHARAVELGAGTGIISLLLAARERLASIYAIEIQDEFFELVNRNIDLNGFEKTVSAMRADIRDVRACDVGGEVDVVFANPPYMRTDSGKRNDSDYKYIARHEVFGDIADFCSAAGRLLKHGGKFYCVWRPDRLSELIVAMRDSRLEPKSMVLVHADVDSEPSMALVCATKGGATGMRIMPPLIMHGEGCSDGGARPMSARAEKIYETMSFYD